jgi:hypothetical protein
MEAREWVLSFKTEGEEEEEDDEEEWWTTCL